MICIWYVIRFSRACCVPNFSCHRHRRITPEYSQLRQYSKSTKAPSLSGGGLYNIRYIARRSCHTATVTRVLRHVTNFPSDMCVLYAEHTPLMSNERNEYILYICVCVCVWMCGWMCGCAGVYECAGVYTRTWT